MQIFRLGDDQEGHFQAIFGLQKSPKKLGLIPFDLEPQIISEALLKAFGTLGSTFGPSQTVSEPLGDQRAVF